MVRFAICMLLLQVSLSSASEDAECLLQVGMQVDQKREISAPDPCECILWSEAYKFGQTLCGNGYEYFSKFHGIPSPLQLGQEYSVFGSGWRKYCHEFYARLPMNFCVNRNLETNEDFGQWCYVSHQCKDLNGGDVGTPYHMGPASLGGQLNSKICTAQDTINDIKSSGAESLGKPYHKGPSLRHTSPSRLAYMANYHNISLSLFLRASYPVNTNYWEVASDVWGIPGDGKSQSLASIGQDLNKIKLSGSPQLFISKTDPTDVKVVVGSTVFAVVPEEGREQKDPSLSSRERLECLVGCDHPQLNQ